jgi:hypothetical protein
MTGTKGLVAQAEQRTPMPERLGSRKARLRERETRTSIVESVDQTIRSRDRDMWPVTTPRSRRVSRPRYPDAESPRVLSCPNVGDVVADHYAVLDRDAELLGNRDQGAGIRLWCVSVRASNQRVVGDAECVEQTLGIPARTLGEDPYLVAYAFDPSGEGRRAARPSPRSSTP